MSQEDQLEELREDIKTKMFASVETGMHFSESSVDGNRDKVLHYADEIMEDITSLIATREAEALDRWKGDINTGFTPKCSYCGIKSRKVVGQTVKGKYSQENNGLPRNWGYYCQKCFDVGMELEREAMYG